MTFSMVMDWLSGLDLGALAARLGVRSLQLMAVWAAAWLAMRLGNAVIDRVLLRAGEFAPGIAAHLDQARARTLAALLKSVLRYTVDFTAIVTFLGVIGVPLGGVLAGAGIAGLAIGFGAQNLMRDIITGFFILLEDQFSVGDYITTDGRSGIVEEIGLRTTRLRDFSGELHIIPNGSIDTVSNFSRGPVRAMVDVGVAYEEDIDRVLAVLAGVCDELASAMRDAIVEGPRVLGVVRLAESGVVVRLWANCRALEQWRVERELLRRTKIAFEREGIEIPYARRVLVPAAATKIAQALARGEGPAPPREEEPS